MKSGFTQKCDHCRRETQIHGYNLWCAAMGAFLSSVLFGLILAGFIIVFVNGIIKTFGL